MRTQLTDLVVRNAKPPASGSTTIWDTSLLGLCLRTRRRSRRLPKRSGRTHERVRPWRRDKKGRTQGVAIERSRIRRKRNRRLSPRRENCSPSRAGRIPHLPPRRRPRRQPRAQCGRRGAGNMTLSPSRRPRMPRNLPPCFILSPIQPPHRFRSREADDAGQGSGGSSPRCFLLRLGSWLGYEGLARVRC